MLADNYICKCGFKNFFNSYGYATWESVTEYFCMSCGCMNKVIRGELLLDEEKTITKTQEPTCKNIKHAHHASKKSPVRKKVRPKKGKKR